MAAISHMLEMVASSRDMASRLVRGAFVGFWLPFSRKLLRLGNLVRAHPFGSASRSSAAGLSPFVAARMHHL